MIDLAGLPIIDVHCHPFTDPGPLTPARFVELSAFPGAGPDLLAAGGVELAAAEAEVDRVRRDTVYFRHLLKCLAGFLGCEPSLEAVTAARNEAACDWPGYVRRLFAAAGIEALVADFGYPQPPVDRGRFEREMPVPVVPVYRIEPLIAGLLWGDAGWDEFRRRYDDAIARALREEGYRGLKSIIAYRTGLDISPAARAPEDGRRALDGVRRGQGGGSMKLLRDHLFCRALELCIEHDVPMQVHTGIGDWEVNLVRCRPALLMELLRTPPFAACRVLLVHGGYPYHAEAGYLANMLPRVYVDISEGVPFAGGAAQRIIAEVLEMAPLSKVVYGSDGFTLPELNYAGAILGRTALAAALGDLAGGGLLSAAEAREAAAGILAGNARRLYGLPGGGSAG